MAAFLEAQVRDLDTRCQQMDGVTRKHTPTLAQPHRLIVVDELASITALADRKDRERIEAALGHLESRGRAAGYTVIVTTVEPTKEVVRWRALHAVRVGFRLEEESHTDMVLGDGSRDRGAVCDHINPDTPGVAYLKTDGVRDPIRFRAVEITDTDLHTLTHGLPPMVGPEATESTGREGEEFWPFDQWFGENTADGDAAATHVRVDVVDSSIPTAPTTATTPLGRPRPTAAEPEGAPR